MLALGIETKTHQTRGVGLWRLAAGSPGMQFTLRRDFLALERLV